MTASLSIEIIDQFEIGLEELFLAHSKFNEREEELVLLSSRRRRGGMPRPITTGARTFHALCEIMTACRAAGHTEIFYDFLDRNLRCDGWIEVGDVVTLYDLTKAGPDVIKRIAKEYNHGCPPVRIPRHTWQRQPPPEPWDEPGFPPIYSRGALRRAMVFASLWMDHQPPEAPPQLLVATPT